MATEIVVEAEDRPGILATIGELFGEIEINIVAAAAFTFAGKGHLHFVVDEDARAVAALERAGFKIMQIHEVLTVTLDDKPGELGRYARKLADSGVNIMSIYTAGARGGEKELILAVDDIEAAQAQK